MGAVLFAEPVPPTQAAAWGMIWEAVPDDDFAETVSARAAQLARGPTAAYRLAQHALRQASATASTTSSRSRRGCRTRPAPPATSARASRRSSRSAPPATRAAEAPMARVARRRITRAPRPHERAPAAELEARSPTSRRRSGRCSTAPPAARPSSAA